MRDEQIRRLVKKWWGIDGCSDSWLPETREYALGHSIRILDAAGFAVVPKEPTKEMCQAAHSALYHWREANGDPQQDPDNMSKHAIRYRAMLAALRASRKDNTE